MAAALFGFLISARKELQRIESDRKPKPPLEFPLEVRKRAQELRIRLHNFQSKLRALISSPRPSQLSEQDYVAQIDALKKMIDENEKYTGEFLMPTKNEAVETHIECLDYVAQILDRQYIRYSNIRKLLGAPSEEVKIDVPPPKPIPTGGSALENEFRSIFFNKTRQEQDGLINYLVRKKDCTREEAMRDAISKYRQENRSWR